MFNIIYSTRRELAVELAHLIVWLLVWACMIKYLFF